VEVKFFKMFRQSEKEALIYSYFCAPVNYKPNNSKAFKKTRKIAVALATPHTLICRPSCEIIKEKCDWICFSSSNEAQFHSSVSPLWRRAAEGHDYRCRWGYETSLKSHYTGVRDSLPIMVWFYYLNIRSLRLCDST
jgi:hypothetical protein